MKNPRICVGKIWLTNARIGKSNQLKLMKTLPVRAVVWDPWYLGVSFVDEPVKKTLKPIGSTEIQKEETDGFSKKETCSVTSP